MERDYSILTMLIISLFEYGVELFILFIQLDFPSHATLGPSKFIISLISRQMLQPHSQGANCCGITFLKKISTSVSEEVLFFHREQKSFSVRTSPHLGGLGFDSKDRS